MAPPFPGFGAAIDEAIRLHRSGHYASAADIYVQLLARAPRDAQLARLAGMALREAGRSEESRAALTRAITLAPTDPAAHFELAVLHQGDGRFDEARRSLDAATRLGPDHQACIALRAQMLFMEGRFDEAYAAVRPALETGEHHPALVLVFARLARRFQREEEAVGLLRRLAAAEQMEDGTRAQALFLIGDLLTDRREYDAAFQTYREANSLVRTTFDADSHTAAIDRLIEAWSAEAIARLDEPACDSELPVFIVGMPRSGTSLVEQMISSLPGVFGGGERNDVLVTVRNLERSGGAISLEHPEVLTARVLKRQSAALLRSYRRSAPDAVRITDKLPDNFLHLGVIARLFPRARVLHCVRDAVDTCLSCYFQYFSGHYDWAYDLTHIGRYYAGYAKIMKHWRRVAEPLGLRMLDVSYESLVNDPESQIRRVVEFVGLPWNPACLAFHQNKRVVNTASNEQVRRPIFKTSAGRHKHYEKYLGPLLESLPRVADEG